MCSRIFSHRMDSEEWSQWQSEFRGQIRALRHWLKAMEMRLPPLDPAVSFSHTLGSRTSENTSEIASIFELFSNLMENMKHSSERFAFLIINLMIKISSGIWVCSKIKSCAWVTWSPLLIHLYLSAKPKNNISDFFLLHEILQMSVYVHHLPTFHDHYFTLFCSSLFYRFLFEYWIISSFFCATIETSFNRLHPGFSPFCLVKYCISFLMTSYCTGLDSKVQWSGETFRSCYLCF